MVDRRTSNTSSLMSSDDGSGSSSSSSSEGSRSDSLNIVETIVSTLTSSLCTSDNKNIAECVQEMTAELRKLNALIQQYTVTK